MSNTDAGFGKYGGKLAVVRTSEVEHPLTQIRRRMAELGATPEMIADAVDAHERGRVDLRAMSEEEMAARVSALTEGTPAAWVEADRESIDAARRDPSMWAEVNTDPVKGKIGVIGLSVGAIMGWVGRGGAFDAGKALLVHHAELERAEQEGRNPRSTLLVFCRGVHGQGDPDPAVET